MSRGLFVLTFRLSMPVLFFFALLLSCGNVKDPMQNDENASVKLTVADPKNNGHWLGDFLEVSVEFVLPNFIDSAKLEFGDTTINITKKFIATCENGDIAKFNFFLKTYGDSLPVTAVIMVNRKEYAFTEYVNVGAHVPEFTQQPVDSLIRFVGVACSLSVKAFGELLTYFWYKDGVSYDSTSGGNLVLPGDTVAESGLYFCIAKNAAGRDTSDTCEVNICSKPLITKDIESATVLPGKEVKFTIEATGGILSYQWQKNREDINLKRSPSFSITEMTAEHMAYYRCIVSNPFGADTSFEAVLLMATVPVIDSIWKNAGNYAAGDVCTLSVIAYGADLKYAWYKDDDLLTGKDTANIVIDSFAAKNSGIYRCIVSNIAGADTSDEVTASLVGKPSIVTDLEEDYYVAPDSSLAIAVKVNGAGVTYRWYRIEGSTREKVSEDSLFTIAEMNPANEGTFQCVISNAAGADSSTITTIRTLEKPEILSFTTGPVSVAENGTIELYVKVKGEQVTYNWLNGNGETVGSTDSLEIKKAAEQHIGYYFCVARNKAGTDTTGVIYVDVRIPDVKKPTLVSLSPADGEGKVAVNLKKVTAVFSEPILGSSIIPGSMYIDGRSGDNVGHGEDSNSVTLTLASELELGTEYTLVIRGSLTDTVGNALGDSILSKFRTATDLTPNAGDDEDVTTNETVTLAGSNNGKTSLPITYAWIQIAGPMVTLNLSVPANPTFKAPAFPTALSFQLQISTVDGSSDFDTVIIRVYKNPDQKLFVSMYGSDNEDGTSSKKPLKTISTALKKADSGSNKDIYIANGRYDEGTLKLHKGVSLFGGYDSTTWMPDSNDTTFINGTTSKGATADSISNVTLSRLVITTGRWKVLGESSVGMKMYRCTTITILNCAILANNGGPGAPGEKGVFCGNPSAIYTGGKGGNGCAIWPQICTEGTKGNPQNGGGGAGGPIGSNGIKGQGGNVGVAGTGGDSVIHLNTDGYYEAQNGADGTDGQNGCGGGGGGGKNTLFGGVGGSGGNGGKGGTGGKGSSGGGASIGMIVVQSKNITIRACSIISTTAGDGGVGGKGGDGCNGAGGNTTDPNSTIGGNGGNGGKGGNGGGGAGGPSIAILIDSTTYKNDYETANNILTNDGSPSKGGLCEGWVKTDSPEDCHPGEDGIKRLLYILP